MGQILSWIRGPRDEPALHNVSVEQQVCDSVFLRVRLCVLSNKVARQAATCVAACLMCLFVHVFCGNVLHVEI